MPIPFELPSWLYHSSHESSQSVSPTASFNPVRALNGSGWSDGIAPLNKPKQKIILIDKSMADAVSDTNLMALYYFFTSPEYHFQVLFWCYNPAGKVVYTSISHLERFDPAHDYKKLFNLFGIVRDQVVALDYKRVSELQTLLQKDKLYGDGYFYNGYKLVVHNDDDVLAPQHTWIYTAKPQLEIIQEALHQCSVLKDLGVLSEGFYYGDLTSLHNILSRIANYRKFVLNVIHNVMPGDRYPESFFIIALHTPILAKNMPRDLLYDFLDRGETVRKLILMNPELRSRLSDADIENALEFQDKNELQDYKKISYKKPNSAHSLSTVSFIEIENVKSKTYDTLVNLFNGELRAEKIAVILFSFSAVEDDPEQLACFNVVFDLLKSLCKNLKAIIVPALFYRMAISAFNNQNICVLKTPGDPAAAESSCASEEIGIKKPGVLYLHNNEMTPYASYIMDEVDDGHCEYHMIEAGEMLTSGIDPLPVRTSLITYQYDTQFSALMQSAVCSEQLSEVLQFATYDDEYVEQCRSVNNDYCYVQFTQRIPALQWTRLRSIHAQDEMIRVRQTGDVCIYKGDDDFHYVYSNTDLLLNYIIALEKKYLIEDQYAALDDNDPIKLIIDDYRNHPEYQVIANPHRPTPRLNDCETYEEWCEKLYDQRAGVCWLRALSLAERIKQTQPAEAYRVRIACINNNHEIIEVLNYGIWLPIDLGGGANITLYYQHNSEEQRSENSQGCTDERSPETRKIEQLESLFVKSVSPGVCETQNHLLSVLSAHDYRKIFLLGSVNAIAHFILQKYNQENKNIFYIDSPDLLDLEKPQVFLDTKGNPSIIHKTALAEFFDRAIGNPSEKSILLIDVREKTLPPSAIVSINTLFDHKIRTYKGLEIPDSVCVVALSDQLPDDTSFLSRQEIILKIAPSIFSEEDVVKVSVTTEDETITIDLMGVADWKKSLFGSIVLEQNQLRWRRSSFTSFFSSGHFILTHYPDNAEKDIQTFCQKSQALGYFDYHGCHIDISEGCTFSFDNRYDFSCFRVDRVYKEVHAALTNEKDFLINTYLFDLLLYDKSVTQGLYTETPGLIEKFSTQTLSLFITSDLCDAQWWALFSHAEKYHVTLHIKLAPSVSFPAGVNYVVADNADLTKYCAENVTSKDALVIHIDDVIFEQLFFSISYQNNGGQFSDFFYQESDVLRYLNNDTSAVILRGEFSESLLSFLHTLLLPKPYLWKNGEKYFFAGTVQLDITNQHAVPTWAMNIIAGRYDIPLPSPDVFDESNYFSFAPEEFIAQRKAQLLTLLSKNSMIKLVGRPGCGKSQLIAMIMRENAENCVVYHESTQLTLWAQDTSVKQKILVITMGAQPTRLFEPLTPNHSKMILIGNKLFQLDEHHKVIFVAIDPVVPVLFSEYVIPEMHISLPSDDVLYAIFLKPIFDSAGLAILESQFKKDCHLFIGQFHRKTEMTLRQLQRFILLYCASHIDQRKNYFLANFFKPAVNAHYILTASSKPVRDNLESFLQIQRLKLNRKLSRHNGLNAVLIEGEPGVGKTAMVSFLLTQSHLSYVKIDASLSSDEIEKKIINAFYDGVGFWIDEYDSCTTPRLDMVINKVLSGEDPNNGVLLDTPCFAIFTGNGGAYAGRRAFGFSFQNRLLCLTLDKPTYDDVQRILTQLLRNCALNPNIDIDLLARDFCELQNRSSRVTLRTLIEQIAQISVLYRNQDELRLCQ